MLAGSLNPNIENQEFRVQRAVEAGQLANQYATNTSVSFRGMLNTSRISKTLGIGGDDAITAGNMEISELRTLQGKSGEEISKAFRNRGIDIPANKATGAVGSLIDLKSQSIIEGGGLGFGLDSASLLSKIKSGKQLTKEEELQLGKAAEFGGFKGGAAELTAQIRGNYFQPDPNSKKATEQAMKGEGGSDILKQLDTMRTSGFKQLSEAALQATKQFGSAAQALKTLGDMTANLEKFGASGGEGKFATAAADSAVTFGKSTVQFEKSVGAFDIAVGKLINASGLSGGYNAGAAAVSTMNTRAAATPNLDKNKGQPK
jgi:hypothetical protein